MTAQTRLLTAEEFAALPTDGMRFELVRGELRVIAPTFADHGAVAGTLHVVLGHYILTQRLGQIYSAETGFLIARNPDTVRAPDIAFIQAARLSPQASAPNWNPIAPDLVAEVVSAGDREAEIEAKVHMWLDFGVRLVWVVYPARREIVVYRHDQPFSVHGAADPIDGEDVVPGFRYPIADLFM